MESNSTHPVGRAVVEYAADNMGNAKATNVEEIAGHGLKDKVDEKEVLAGNLKLLKKFNIDFPSEIEKIVDTNVVVA